MIMQKIRKEISPNSNVLFHKEDKLCLRYSAEEKIDKDIGIEYILNAAPTKELCPEEILTTWLKLEPNDADLIISVLRSVIVEHNQVAEWKPKDFSLIQPVPFGGFYSDVVPKKEICYNTLTIPEPHFSRLGQFIPPQLSPLPELKEVWNSIKIVLWSWEKISRANWEYRHGRQLTLKSQPRVFYNPERYYLLLIISRLSFRIPSDIIVLLNNYLPPIFYARPTFLTHITFRGTQLQIFLKFNHNRGTFLFTSEGFKLYEKQMNKHSGKFHINNHLIYLELKKFECYPATIPSTPDFERMILKITPNLKFGGIKLNIVKIYQSGKQYYGNYNRTEYPYRQIFLHECTRSEVN